MNRISYAYLCSFRHLSGKSPATTGDEMISRMDSLTKTLKRVTLNQGALQHQNSRSVLKGQSLKNTERLKGAAKEILYQSSLLAKSVGSETSVAEEDISIDPEETMRNFRQLRIERWIPQPDSHIQTPRRIRVLETSPLGHGVSISVYR